MDDPQAAWVHMIMERLHILEHQNDELKENNTNLKLAITKLQNPVPEVRLAGIEQHSATWKIIVIDEELHFQGRKGEQWISLLRIKR